MLNREQSIYEKLGFKVEIIQSDDLGKLGGGLHCISWCY